MAEARQRTGKPAIALRVLRSERLTPHMIRIVAGGEGIRDFTPNDYTDAYVKVLFKVPGVTYPEPFDLQVIRATLPREQCPRMRSYTVRAFDAQAGELTLDFVHHGDEGLAGPWAAGLKPGDELLLSGPGGAYAPSAEADWHLLAGDESALPAIAASLEAMPAGVPVHAFILVEDAAEEQHLVTKADAQITWLHRSAGELTTRALGAKQASSRASKAASPAPPASSGRRSSSPSQSSLLPAEPCLTRISGVVSRGRRPPIRSASCG